MSTANVEKVTRSALEHNEGILRLAPNWVPRTFLHPGRRLKLAECDLYALGADRGGIDERWLSSTIPADNPGAGPDEGHSFVVHDGQRVRLKDAIDALGAAIIGKGIWERYGKWPVFGKFFDNMGMIPHHMHQSEQHAKLVGREPKPEAYYFPPQLNRQANRFPYTFFGLEPGTTREQVKECLRNWNRGDNRITDLSRAYRLEPGTGWDVPAGVLHAPGSLCTYEPQADSDVFAMFESLVDNAPIARDLLVKDVPPEHHDDLDYLVDLLDWNLNTDPAFVQHRFLRPRPVRDEEEMRADGCLDCWITYRSPEFSAKETTVLPGASVTLRDAAAYGLILLQGHGALGPWQVEAPTMIRYGQLTSDEFYVTEGAAREGVRVVNPSATDPLVMLRHYGPGNPDLGDVE